MVDCGVFFNGEGFGVVFFFWWKLGLLCWIMCEVGEDVCRVEFSLFFGVLREDVLERCFFLGFNVCNVVLMFIKVVFEIVVIGFWLIFFCRGEVIDWLFNGEGSYGFVSEFFGFFVLVCLYLCGCWCSFIFLGVIWVFDLL